MRTEQTTVLDALRRLGGRATSPELARLLGVSPRTIQRRLEELAAKKLVQKVGQAWRIPDTEIATKTTVATILIHIESKGKRGGPETRASGTWLGSGEPSGGPAHGPDGCALGPGLHVEWMRQIYVLEVLCQHSALMLASEARNEGFRRRKLSRSRHVVSSLREIAAQLNAGRNDAGYVRCWPSVDQIVKQRIAVHEPDWPKWYRWCENRVVGRVSRYERDASYDHLEFVSVASEEDVTMPVPGAPEAAAGAPEYPTPSSADIQRVIDDLEE